MVHISIIFVVHMYCPRGIESNGQRAGVGDKTCTGTYSNHPRPVSGAPTPHTCCKTKGACRVPPLTYYGIPGTGTWYQVGNRGPYPRVSVRLDGPTMCLHVRASRPIPSMVQQPKPSGKKRLAPTTLPVDSTSTYMIYAGIM